jgi:TPR repeat protein/DNA-directed RNA polymerase subunit RPC12/RpoP
MADVKIGCPKCGGHIAFSAEMAGREVACPHCGGSLALPKAKSNLTLILIGVVVALLAVGGGVVAMLPHGKASQPKVAKSPQLSAFEIVQNKAASGDPDAMGRLGVFYLEGEGVPTNQAEGMAWIKKAANAGQVHAMTLLGEYLLMDAARAYYAAHPPVDPATNLPSDGMTMNDVPAECLNWFRRAAELDGTNAMWQLVRNLNLCTSETAKKAIDPATGLPQSYPKLIDPDTGFLMSLPTKEAIRWLGRLSELGDPEAMIQLGSIYLLGANVELDPEAGIKLYQKAGDRGSLHAYRVLGQVYKTGIGVSRDAFQAIDWYKKAADKDDTKAELALATLYKTDPTVKDLEQSFRWYSKVAVKIPPATQGDTAKEIEALAIEDAYVPVAEAYDKGLGVVEDQAAALAWYLKAANAGIALAQFRLGVKYDLGKGVSKDKAKALQWYLKAADQAGWDARFCKGVVESQRNIGYLYQAGGGVPKDPREAFNWFLKAAGNGCEAAQYEVAKAYNSGVGVLQDKQAAFDWFQKAANNGDESAQTDLALLYLEQVDGSANTPENRIMAYAWLNLVAAQGKAEAASLRNDLIRKMSALEVAEAQRRAKAFSENGMPLTNAVSVLGASATPVAARPRTTSAPVLEVLNVTTKMTEQNGTWRRYGYRLSARNNGGSAQQAQFEIQFFNDQGYVIHSTTIASAFAPGETATLTGDTLMELPGTARVANVKAVWKQ